MGALIGSSRPWRSRNSPPPKPSCSRPRAASGKGGKPKADPTGTGGKKGHKAKGKHKHHGTWNDKHWRWVPTADGDWRVQGYIFHHKHKPPKHHFRGPGPKPAVRVTPAPPPATGATETETRPPGAFQGAFGIPQANRLLTRAGFGPAPGQAEQLVALGMVGAVQSLTRPSGAAVLSGPAPTDDEGNPLAPATIWGHDHLWWLDRMIRTDQPLVERMALVLHDWFATSQGGVSTPQQMIDQSNLFRSACFGSFLDLFKAVTVDPAMLQWLNGVENVKGAPNENYGREMMELFSLGADRGAYTEDDIREQARSLTGWRNDWSSELGAYNFRFEARRHDTGVKTVFGRSGNWGWEEAVRALRRTSPPPLLLRHQAVELLRADAALGGDAGEPRSRPTSPRAGRSARCWRRS